MTAEEFTTWASSPEGMAILGTGGAVVIGTALYKTGVAARCATYAWETVKAGYNSEKPRAYVRKTAAATTLLIIAGSLTVPFDGAYAKATPTEQLTNEALIILSQYSSTKRPPSRADISDAIVQGKSQL